MGNTWGQFFRVTTWGESHGEAVGAVIDGCPPGIVLDWDRIQLALDRRRPGQSPLVSPRQEADRLRVRSGIYEGKTLGTPIALEIPNTDARSADYQPLQNVFRPSHADFTYHAKFGLRDPRGGGRASARETVARVAAGALAQQVLEAAFPLKLAAYVVQVGEEGLHTPVQQCPAQSAIEASPVRCPDPEASRRMVARIEKAQREGDSVGGVIACHIEGVPAGWGCPVFDRLEADLAKAMLSIPACRGFELGSGFGAAQLGGRQHNDPFCFKPQEGRIGTQTNHSGGVQGGISNGEALYFRLAFKPPATLPGPMEAINAQGQTVSVKLSPGRHDPCVLPRAVPIVEAMATLVLVEHWMRQRAQTGT